MSDFTYTTKSGATITLPDPGSVPAGVLRAARRLEDVDAMFTLIEGVATPETLAVIDALPLIELNEVFTAWKNPDSGVALPES